MDNQNNLQAHLINIIIPARLNSFDMLHVMVNLGKDVDTEAIQSECEQFGEIRAFKYFKQLNSIVVVFNDVRAAVDCKLVMQSKRTVAFGDVCDCYYSYLSQFFLYSIYRTPYHHYPKIAIFYVFIILL